MELKEIHDFIALIERKERGAFHSHAEIDAVLDRAQMQLFSEYLDVYLSTQKIADALSPFKAAYIFTNSTSVNGIITLPLDYMHLLNVSTSVFNNTLARAVTAGVRMLPEDEIDNARNSQLRAVSTDYPIGINKAGTIQLYPAVPQAGTVYYLRRPAKPVYVFTLTGRVETYNQAGSTQIEFLDVYTDKIIAKALSYLAINLNEMQQVQYAEAKDKMLA